MATTVDMETGDIIPDAPTPTPIGVRDDGVVDDVVTITAPSSAFKWVPWAIMSALVLWYLKDGQNKGEDLW